MDGVSNITHSKVKVPSWNDHFATDILNQGKITAKPWRRSTTMAAMEAQVVPMDYSR